MPCIKSGGFKYVRVTQVDTCGRPTGFAVINDCSPTISVSPQVDEGEDITFPDGRGENCAVIPACPSYNGDQVTWTFYDASPELFQVITGGQPRFDDEGNMIGIATCDIQCRAGFALETWTDVVTDEGCEPDAEGEGQWGYFLWPFLTAPRLGDYELAAGAITFSVTARTRSGSAWGRGPWDVHIYADGTEGPLFEEFPPDCLSGIFEITNMAPPEEPVCELIPVPVESPS